MSRSIKVAVGIIISVGSLILAFWNVDFGAFSQELGKVKLWACIPSLAILIVHYILRAYRWRFLLPEGKDIPIRELHDGIMIGNLASYILPLRAGEFIRPLVLSKRSTTPFSTAFSTVVIERFFDLAAVLLSLALVTPHIPALPSWVITGANALTIVAAILIVGIIVGCLAPDTIARLVATVTKPLPDKLRNLIIHFADNFLAGAKVLRSPTRVLLVTALTVVIWLSAFALSYVLTYFVSVDVPLLFGVVIGVIIALAVAAPSAPGFVGVYQIACLASFELYNLPNEVALSYAVVTHIFQYLFVVLVGIFCLSRVGMTFAELTKTRTKSV